MAWEDFNYDPADGLENEITFEAKPANGPRARQQFMVLFNQIKAFFNGKVKETSTTLGTHLTDNAAHGVSHKNLLHNWDFRNPVNQRGRTVYNSGGYNIDRWLTYGDNIEIAIVAGGVELRKGAGIYSFFSKIEYESTATQVHTISCLIGNTIFSASGYITENPSATLMVATPNGHLRAYKSANLTVVDFVVFTATTKVSAVKLELGSVSTLANDPPADYGEQLRLCQRYYIGAQSGGFIGIQHLPQTDLIYYFVPLPTKMRIFPTLSGDWTIFKVPANSPIGGFTITVQEICANGVILKASKAVHGETNTYLYSLNGGFSADL